MCTMQSATRVVYTDESSYSARMHKIAYDGIIGIQASLESVEKFREMDFTALHDKLARNLDFYLGWIKNEFKQVSNMLSVILGCLHPCRI